MQIIGFLNKYVFGVGVPVMLILLGIFYCFKLRFFHLLHPLKIIKTLFEGKKEGGVSPLKALTLALAGTLGVGNMVGVASAIVLGGFGAIFWMWVSAFIAMILKYAEIVLAIKYRKFDKDGKPYGGAMYYIRACIKDGRAGAFIALMFALFCVFNSVSMGSMIQINAVSEAFVGVFDAHPAVIGVFFSVITLFALLRGTSGILTLTEKLVPIMTGGFVVLSILVIVLFPSRTLHAFELIFSDAFDIKSGIGGALGFLTSDALRYGTMRGILSNEAGCGTAPAAHAVTNCNVPAKQGVFGIIEVFVDTVVLCTLTALCVLLEYDAAAVYGGHYMMMTIAAYSSALGAYAGYFLSTAVGCFALATVICWGHYGWTAVEYLGGGRHSRWGFCVIYAACVLIGAYAPPNIAWQLSDLSISVMTVINLGVLLGYYFFFERT